VEERRWGYRVGGRDHSTHRMREDSMKFALPNIQPNRFPVVVFIHVMIHVWIHQKFSLPRSRILVDMIYIFHKQTKRWIKLTAMVRHWCGILALGIFLDVSQKS